MNLNKLKISLAAGLAVMSFAAGAQNLDPTVVVNRAYEGKLMEVHKPMLEMAVPDSLRQFDLDFDYSVFENPYKGSYEFKPYELLMKPVSADMDKSVFWLKAGAGYSLYPVFDMVWTPFHKGRFKMNVYADYQAYIGEYRFFMPTEAKDGVMYMDRWRSKSGTTSEWNGYRMRSKAGIDGRYDWDKNVMTFDVGYYGIASKDTLKNRMFDALDVKINVASKPQNSDYFHYDAYANYRFGEDKARFRLGDKYLAEHDFKFGAVVGPVISNMQKVLMDVGFETVAYTGAFAGEGISELYIVPHYLLTKGRWNFDLGVRFSMLISPKESAMYNTKSQLFYPDVNVAFSILPDALGVYAKLGGGNRINTYSSLLERNPYVDMDFGYSNPLLDADVERVAASLGFKGRIAGKFTYDIHGGFKCFANALLDSAVLLGGESDIYRYLPTYSYAGYNKLYAGLDWNLRMDAISFNGSVEYSHITRLADKVGVIAPAPLTADVAFEYNWKRRVFAGIDCYYSSARRGNITSLDAGIVSPDLKYKTVVPGFADLGVYAELASSRKLSFWLRGGNLLNMTVQRTPLYAEKGINFTAGICLKL
jgi:hypothetical protein